jgi:signal transduction histidine kinase
MTILIVDDLEENLEVLRVVLGLKGYPVVTATNGADALAAARQAPPDLIISDILMPVMDGFALCREWKQDPQLQGIPFVFYTATYTDGRDRSFALGLGAERFLTKPQPPNVLLAVIQELLPQTQEPGRTPAQPVPPSPAPPAAAVDTAEVTYLRSYSETLVRKLERKLEQLEQDVAQRQRVEEELRKSREQLRALLARQQTLREDERMHIAREIHDELGQRLTGLKLDLNWIERYWDDAGNDNRLLEKVVSAESLVDDIITTVQRIALELRSDVLGHLGLTAALRGELEAFQERTGLVCTLAFPATEPPVAKEVAVTFFRVYQEALTNVARHAAARTVAARFEVADGWGLLEVRDDGKGISVADLQNARSLGLLGMQERVRLLGGTVSVARGATGGTVARFRIPVGTGTAGENSEHTVQMNADAEPHS